MDGWEERPARLAIGFDGYRITDDRRAIDADLVCGFLQQSYWGRGRSRARILRSFDHAICFSLLRGDRQVGFARAVSDHAFLCWIADVFVVPEERGRGLSKRLMQAVFDHPDLRDVSTFFLGTADAHGLYRRFGFETITDPSRFMRLKRDEP